MTEWVDYKIKINKITSMHHDIKQSEKKDDMLYKTDYKIYLYCIFQDTFGVNVT